jgi:hypothetical protein
MAGIGRKYNFSHFSGKSLADALKYIFFLPYAGNGVDDEDNLTFRVHGWTNSLQKSEENRHPAELPSEIFAEGASRVNIPACSGEYG